MHILVVANGYPSDKEPQFGCFEKDQAVELKKQGHEVTIMYIDGRFRTYYRKRGISHIVYDGINVYGIYLFPIIMLELFSYKLSNRFRSFLMMYLFKYIFKNNKLPDIIYAHYCYNIANVIEIGNKFKVPVVGIEHWSEMNQSSLSNKALYLGNIAYNNISQLLSVSESLSNSIYRNFKVKSFVVNDMVGNEFVSEIVKPSLQPSNEFIFVAIGSLIQRKGFGILIEAFYKSNLFYKGVTLIIIGDGSEKSNLQDRINQLKIEHSVILVGRKTKKEIISYLKNGNCFVLSSYVETFGVVCIEALTLGLPVIATICGGPEEYINNTNGILVMPGEVSELSEAMITMFENYNQYDPLAIAQNSRNSFAPSVIAKKLINIFVSVIDKEKIRL